jgi:glycine/D-amino acid oxidase-like deaminating enzyme
MNLSSGYPFDLIRNGIPYDYPRLTTDRTTDVVVMGGGISGALSAFFMRKAGVNCLLVDGRSIGLGSTCASTSLLQYEIDKPLHRLAEQIGKAKAEHCYHLSGGAIDTLEMICSEIGFNRFHRSGSMYFAATHKDMPSLEKEYEARLNSGFDIRWADAAELKNNYGLTAPAAIISSLGAQTNAYLLTHALHQHNIKQGLEVFDRTPVVKIVHSKKGVVLVTSEGHEIRCKKLVYATGYESVKYIDRKIVQLSATYATASEQFSNDHFFWDGRMVFWNTADPYFYMRLTADNRILAGGRDEPFTSPRKMDAVIEKKGKALGKDLTRYFPAIPFKKEFSWTGLFGSTKDGLPFVGSYPKLPNSFFALGFGGNGITFSVLAAEMAKDAVTGKKNKDAQLFSFSRL